jgi:nuclear migration protein JNM1
MNSLYSEYQRQRTQYIYPPSPSASEPEHQASVAQRLRQLQAEVAALETDLATSADAAKDDDAEDEPDTGEMLKGLVEVRGRLERMRVNKEGRGRLGGAVTEEGFPGSVTNGTKQGTSTKDAQKEVPNTDEEKVEEKGEPKASSIAEMDKRVGQLEDLVGSSSTTLDEVRLGSICATYQTLTTDFFSLLLFQRLCCRSLLSSTPN